MSVSLPLFLGILGYDVFLDEQGDVQQNLTVMTLSDNIGKTKGCNSNDGIFVQLESRFSFPWLLK